MKATEVIEKLAELVRTYGDCNVIGTIKECKRFDEETGEVEYYTELEGVNDVIKKSSDRGGRYFLLQ